MVIYYEHEMLFQASMPPSFHGLDYSIDHMNKAPNLIGQTSCDNNNPNQIVDYMVNTHPTPPPPPPPPQITPSFCGGSTSLDKLNFADVMQFADFGPKLALNETKVTEEDPVYFLKFPVLNEKVLEGNNDHFHSEKEERYKGISMSDHQEIGKDSGGGNSKEDGGAAAAVQLRFLGENLEKYPPAASEGNNNNKGKRKRPRIKSNEEVESQRMTHIAVERNRRKQMNEHLRVLRSLMPGSYVQRGDQASIIGGAIEFVRELEQLLQCLESQKRRRLYGDAPAAAPRLAGDSSTSPLENQPPPFFPLPNEYEAAAAGMCEETAGSKSCLADVEVKLLGFDGMIKILSRRRPGQLIKIIASLEDLQLNILHTNITTIEQTVLYSFNVKISSETRYTAEDLANSVQQIFSFINANSTTYDM